MTINEAVEETIGSFGSGKQLKKIAKECLKRLDEGKKWESYASKAVDKIPDATDSDLASIYDAVYIYTNGYY